MELVVIYFKNALIMGRQRFYELFLSFISAFC